MSDKTIAFTYQPDTAPTPDIWLATPSGRREAAILRWLARAELAFPRPEVGHWREVEDQLAAGYPPEIRRLLEQILETGTSRAVAVWALASVAGQRQFAQLNRMARRPTSPAVFGLERLLDARDFSILQAAFEAGREGFGSAHGAVIEHYCRHYAPADAMNTATAAGFCFGHAASPGRYRTVVDLESFLLGGELGDEVPDYLPIHDCYRALHEYVADSLFGELDPIPEGCRLAPKPDDGLAAPFGDWCKGLTGALRMRADDWRAHLEMHPRLQPDHQETIDALALADADDRPSEPELAADRRTEIAAAARHLYRLAHPMLLETNTG